jgi:hypothetical protein
MAGLGSLFIDLLARTGKFETDIGRAARVAERRAKEIDRSFSRLGSRITGALGGIAAGFSVAAIIEETSKAERALAALDIAVRNNAGAAGVTTQQLADLSSELQRLTTYGDDSIQEMQALLLTFRQIGGPEFERAQTVILDLATALGKDLNSAAMLVGRALADPEKGMKQLARSGVVLSDEQKKLVKQLVETGRAAEAQGYLLDQLEQRFGGAAQAARNTFGGALAGLKNAFGDLLEAKGGLPEATAELNKLSALLQDPSTIAAADALTSGLIVGFGKAAKAIADTAGTFKFLGESVAAALHGAAIDDIVRLEDQLKELQEFRSKGIFNEDWLDRLRFFDSKNGFIEWYSDADLDKAIAEIQTKIKSFYERGSNRPVIVPPVGGGSGTSFTPPPSEEFVKLSEKLEEQIALYGKVGKAAEIAYQIQSGALDELSKSEQQQLLALARRYDAIVKSSDAQKKAAEEQKRAVDEVQKMTRSLEEQIATFGMGETAVLEYRLTHGDLAKAFADGSEESEKLKQRLLDLTRELEIMTEAAEKAAEAIEEFAKQNEESLEASIEAFEADVEAKFKKGGDAMTVFVEEAARGTQNIIADSLINGFDKGAKGVLQSFGEMMVKITAEIVAADLTRRLFGALGTLGGTGTAGTGWLAAFGGGRAIGGPVLAGTTYRINEREPEFFRPRVGGNVIPLSKMNMGGGMVVNQNFSVRSETGERVSRSTEQQIAAAASRGMAVASRRNN